DDGFGGLADELIGELQGLGDVGAAAELDGEEDIHRLADHVGEVGDFGVEEEEAGADGGYAGEDGGHDGGEDGGIEHGAGLVGGDDHVPGAVFAFGGVEVDAVDEEALGFGVVVVQVAADGALQVKVAVDAAGGVLVAADRSGDGGFDLDFELL